MSNKAIDWAYETDLPHKLKTVLAALADCHNARTGQCNPKVETLADKLGKSKRAIQYNLKELEKMGYIRKLKRRKGVRQASNQYVLALDGVVFQGATGCTLTSKKKCRKLHPESVENCTLYKEPEVEPTRARPTNVVKVDFGAGNSGQIEESPDAAPTSPSRHAEKEGRNHGSG